jgi:hypothetical protein
MSETSENQKEKRVFAIAVRPDLYKIITTEAKSRELSRSAFVRLAVSKLLDTEQKKETR